MVAGDVVADAQSITTATSLIFQPAVGVEVLITSCDSSGPGADQLLGRIDGGLITRMQTINDNAVNVKVFINNTNHLRLTNNSGVTANMGFTGIQTQ